MAVSARLGGFSRALTAAGIVSVALTQAGAASATWDTHPQDGDWNNSSNWTPQTVPDEPTDVATFGPSDTTQVIVSSHIFLASIVFAPGAPAYNVTPNFGLDGAGVVNNSGVTQNITCLQLAFDNNATAGSGINYTNNGSVTPGFFTAFFNRSSAATATFVINGAPEGGYQGALLFADFSTAANSTITINGPQGGENGGGVNFLNSSTAGNSHITVNAGGYLFFDDGSTAANAVLTVAGGSLSFEDKSDAGLAQVQLSDSGTLTIIGHPNPPFTLGSLAGTGIVEVFAPMLSIGSNGIDTAFAGVIEHEGSKGTTAVSKVGTGTLTLSGLNTYNGGTTVTAGTLLVSNTKGSVTGTGPVQVNAGTFGGRSSIAGALTIGSGSGTGAFLAPGINGPGILTIKNSLTFQADGVYQCDLNLKKARADEVTCKSVTIAPGAQFTLQARGRQALPSGTIFTVINNAGERPISGTFANLADGAVLAVGKNQLQASYQGGNGNDLTLTVQ